MTKKAHYKELLMEAVRSMTEDEVIKEAIGILNKIFEHELASAVRYTQYSMMIFGHARKPIQGSLQSWADESMLHARQVGELVTAFGGQVSLGIGDLLDRHYGHIDEMLEQMMLHEVAAIELYYKLMKLAESYDKPGSVMLDEFARTMILEEEQHLSEIEKMLRKRGEGLAHLLDN